MPRDWRQDTLRELLGPSLARQLAEVARLKHEQLLLRPMVDLMELSGIRGTLADLADARSIMTSAAETIRQTAGAQAQLERLRQETEGAVAHQALAIIEQTANFLPPIPDSSISAVMDATGTTETEFASLTGQLIQHVARLNLVLPTDGIARTLHELLAQEKQAWTSLLGAYQPAATAFEAVDSALEAAGLTPMLEEFNRTLHQPKLADQLQSVIALFPEDLQVELTEELFRQPDWRDLLERIAASPDPDGAQPAPESTNTDVGRRTHWRLKQQFLEVYNRIVRPVLGRHSRSVRQVAFWLPLASLAFQFHNAQKHGEIHQGVERLPAEFRAATQARQWTLAAGTTVTLRTQPILDIGGGFPLHGETKLVERRRTGQWIEVDAWDCDENHHVGWIQEEALIGLSGPESEICMPSETPAPPDIDPADEVPEPEPVSEAGHAATTAWREFFVARIANANTRQAYFRACTRFFDWCSTRSLSLGAISAVDVAAWRDTLQHDKSAATVKLHLTAVRRLFDCLVDRHVVPVNPVESVRTPRHPRARTTTPSLRPGEVVTLFESFDLDCLADLRDRALIAIMTFALARASAVSALKTSDVELDGPSPWLRLPEKRGLDLRLPLNSQVTAWIRSYIDAADIAEQPGAPLFRSLGRGRGERAFTGRGLSRQDIYAIVRRRFKRSGIRAAGGCHALRTTGITLLLMRGVPIEVVAKLAGHASIEMTRRYDHRDWQDMQAILDRLLGADTASPP